MRLIHSARWLMLTLFLLLIPATSNAGVFISINFGPPLLPVYEQPICPEPNLIWMPGYWAYGEDGYFWVPGAWVPAPFEGGLWTPPYWGWSSGLYIFHPGYWGYHVGYYGGVNYGYGYEGIGFSGGEWRGHEFAYNRAVMHVDERRVRNTYEDRSIVERSLVARDSHVAYSGGPGGINHPMSQMERLAEHEQHIPPTSFQSQHILSAESNHQSYVKFNGGRPANFAVPGPLPLETRPAPPMSKAVVEPGTRLGSSEVGGGRPSYPAPVAANGANRLPPVSVGHAGSRLGSSDVGGRPTYPGSVPSNGAKRLPPTSTGSYPNTTLQEHPSGGFTPLSNNGATPPHYNPPPRTNEMRDIPPPRYNPVPRNTEMRSVAPPPHFDPPPRTNEIRQNPPPSSNPKVVERPKPGGR